MPHASHCSPLLQVSDSEAEAEGDEPGYKCECGICLCSYSQPYVGTCGHVFCKQCLVVHTSTMPSQSTAAAHKLAVRHHKMSIRVRDMIVRTQKYVKAKSSRVDMTKLSTSQFVLPSKVLAVAQCPVCRTAGAFSRVYL